ncbi:hypothetical protein SNE40_005281 [Patella caerulea]
MASITPRKNTSVACFCCFKTKTSRSIRLDGRKCITERIQSKIERLLRWTSPDSVELAHNLYDKSGPLCYNSIVKTEFITNLLISVNVYIDADTRTKHLNSGPVTPKRIDSSKCSNRKQSTKKKKILFATTTSESTLKDSSEDTTGKFRIDFLSFTTYCIDLHGFE